MLEGICWRYRTGAPWRDVPAEFGPWQTVWKRHFRWSTDGAYEQRFAAVQATGMLDEEAAEAAVEQLLAVDATIVRAHQSSAGARKDSALAQAQGTTGGCFESQQISD